MTQPDRFEEAKEARRIVGSNSSYTIQTRGLIPDQWSEWEYHKVEGVVSNDVYGVSHSFAKGPKFDYLCGLPVEDDAPVPEGQSEIVIPAGTYAVYVHDGHISSLSSLFDAIICGDAPKRGWTFGAGPQFELYGDEFDGSTSTGKVELWFPIIRIS